MMLKNMEAPEVDKNINDIFTTASPLESVTLFSESKEVSLTAKPWKHDIVRQSHVLRRELHNMSSQTRVPML